ncbi:hypothetical protein FRC19_011204 [Serendipita sp. 401]|nr:hypothetical protein FRC19_011204 [Serendipita sp. 401]
MNTYQHLISGGVSGFASAVVLQPFDLVKTRLQQDNKFHTRNSIASNSGTRVVSDSLGSDAVPTTKGSTKGAKGPSIPRVFMKIWREEGRLALWRGTGATLARNVPGVALYYTSLQHVRNTFATLFSSAVVTTRPGAEKGRVSTLTVLSPTGNLAAGALTRTAIGFVLNPLTIVKARFESNYYSYRGITQAVISLSREGAGGSGSLAYRKLFQGFTATALRDAPYAGIFLVVYEGVKQKLGKQPPLESLHSYRFHHFLLHYSSLLFTSFTYSFWPPLPEQMRVHHSTGPAVELLSGGLEASRDEHY